MCLQYNSFENTMVKGEIACINFSYTFSVFYSFAELSAIFIKFESVIYKLFQFGPVRNTVLWEMVNVRLM